MSRPEQFGGQSSSATAALAVISAATMLCLIVFTVPLTTIGSIADDLAADVGAQAWIMSGMPVGAATGLLGFGALGDNLGRRRIFLAGLVIVALSSFAATLAKTALLLIVARIAQGVGSAAILACGLGLIGQVFTEGAARARAAGIWAAGLGAGVAVGPIVAATLLPMGGWPASHWMVAALCIALFGFGVRSIPRDLSRAGAKVDLAGMLVFATAIICFLSALTETRIGFSLLVAVLFVLSAAFASVFVLVERRAANPVLELGLFRRRDFVGATMGAFASGAGVLSIMTLVPLVLEQGLGTSPVAAAIILTAWSATTAIAALGARYLPQGWSPRTVLLASIAGCAAGQLALVVVGSHSNALVLLPGLFLAGVSNGVLNAALGHQAVQTVPADRTAMGSAANNTARYLGSAIGITIAAMIIAHGATGAAERLFESWHMAVLVSVAFSLIGLAATILLSDRGPRFMTHANE